MFNIANYTFQVRRKFALVMDEFGLGGGGESGQDKELEPTKALFRDKKLTRLWEKVPVFFLHFQTHDLSWHQQIISFIIYVRLKRVD